MKHRQKTNSHSALVLVLAFSLIIFCFELLCPEESLAQAATATPYTGKLNDGGTEYHFLVPNNWNGTLFISLDTLTLGPGNFKWHVPLRDWFISHGYAVAGTARDKVGWDLGRASANLIETLDLFSKTVGKPRRTIVWGYSRGGMTTRTAIQLYPDRFDGALPMCGGGAGTISMWNQKLDGAFVLDVLLGAEYDLRLKLQNIQDLNAELDRIKKILEKAQQTPQGRARVALAGVFPQIPVWNQPDLQEPAKDDYESQEKNIALGLPYGLGTQFIPFLENLAGGPVSWNHGVDYKSLLDRSAHKNLIQQLYKKAGLDLEADLHKLARAPRLSAKASAVSFIEKRNITWTGKIRQPVLALMTTGDMAGPISDENSYAEIIGYAGNNNLLRQIFVHRAGHCNFTGGEVIGAFAALLQRMDTGKWGDTSAQGMTQFVKKSQSESAIDLGRSDFVQVNPPKAMRTWDVRNWDTYKPDLK